VGIFNKAGQKWPYLSVLLQTKMVPLGLNTA
jgi:hypothetical protein